VERQEPRSSRPPPRESGVPWTSSSRALPSFLSASADRTIVPAPIPSASRRRPSIRVRCDPVTKSPLRPKRAESCKPLRGVPYRGRSPRATQRPQHSPSVVVTQTMHRAGPRVNRTHHRLPSPNSLSVGDHTHGALTDLPTRNAPRRCFKPKHPQQSPHHWRIAWSLGFNWKLCSEGRVRLPTFRDMSSHSVRLRPLRRLRHVDAPSTYQRCGRFLSGLPSKPRPGSGPRQAYGAGRGGTSQVPGFLTHRSVPGGAMTIASPTLSANCAATI